MCHPEVPAGTPVPDVRVADAAIPVEDGTMPGLMAFPERVPAPGILIINDVFGRSPFYDHLARRLAQAGFVAITPEYFFREGSLPEPTREAAMARAKRLDFKRWGRDMSVAIDWLQTRPEVAGPIGTVGFCMGGTQVLLLAARRGTSLRPSRITASRRMRAPRLRRSMSRPRCTGRSSATGAIRTKASVWRTSTRYARRSRRPAHSTSSTSIPASGTAS